MKKGLFVTPPAKNQLVNTPTPAQAQKKEKFLEQLNENSLLNLPDELILSVINHLSAHDVAHLALSYVIPRKISALINPFLSRALSRYDTPRDLRLIRDYWEYDTHAGIREWMQRHLKPAWSRQIILASSSTKDDVLSLLHWHSSDKKPVQKTQSSDWAWLFSFVTGQTPEARAARSISKLKAKQYVQSDDLNELVSLIPELNAASCLSVTEHVLGYFPNSGDNLYRKVLEDIIVIMAKKFTDAERDALLSRCCIGFAKHLNNLFEQHEHRRWNTPTSTSAPFVVQNFIQLFTHHLSEQHVAMLLDPICVLIIKNKNGIKSTKTSICSMIRALLPLLSVTAVNKVYAAAREAFRSEPSVLSVGIYTELSAYLTLEQKEEVVQHLNDVFNAPKENMSACVAGLECANAINSAVSKEQVEILFQAAIDAGHGVIRTYEGWELMVALVPRLTEDECHRAWNELKKYDVHCAGTQMKVIAALLSRGNTLAFSIDLVHRFLERDVKNLYAWEQQIMLLGVMVNYAPTSELKVYLKNMSSLMRYGSSAAYLEGCKILDVFMPRLTKEDMQPFIPSLGIALFFHDPSIYKAVIRTIKNIMNNAAYAACREDWFDQLIEHLNTDFHSVHLERFALLLCSEDLDVSLKKRLVQRIETVPCSVQMRALINTVIEINTDLLSESGCDVERTSTSSLN